MTATTMGAAPAAAPPSVSATNAPLYDTEAGLGGMSSMSGGVSQPVATGDRAAQAGFLEKVYALVLANLVVTTVVAFTFTMTPAVRMAMWRHRWVLAIGILLWFTSFLALAFVKADPPLNALLLAACVLGMSVGIGIFCASYYHAGWGGVVLQALLACVLVFGGITVYLHTTQRDFSFLGGFLASAAVIVLVLLVLTFGTTLAIGKRMRVQYFITSIVISFSMVAYLQHGIASLVNRFAANDWVAAVISLYTDIVRFCYLVSNAASNART